MSDRPAIWEDNTLEENTCTSYFVVKFNSPLSPDINLSNFVQFYEFVQCNLRKLGHFGLARNKLLTFDSQCTRISEI
jgi:hypothetical protein